METWEYITLALGIIGLVGAILAARNINRAAKEGKIRYVSRVIVNDFWPWSRKRTKELNRLRESQEAEKEPVKPKAAEQEYNPREIDDD